MYKDLLGMRSFEEKLIEIYALGKVPGHIHSGVGEEAVFVGTLATRKDGDYFKISHRDIGSSKVIGMSYQTVFSEILGKDTGNSHGFGGVNHLSELSKGILGMSGALACDIPIAVGAAYSIKMFNRDNLAYIYFGEGTTSRGPTHEAMNWASAWKLPVLFIVINNQWAISTSIKETSSVENPGADRGPAYGMPSKVADGTDVFAVYDAAKELVDDIRMGNGPAILEIKTYRWRGHFEGDQARYRDAGITEEWKKKDCVKKLEEYMLGDNIVTPEEIQTLRNEINRELDEAIAFAEAAPDPKPDELYRNLYA
jgi:pyruvate dehydrogenase E1 component alpha subunit